MPIIKTLPALFPQLKWKLKHPRPLASNLSEMATYSDSGGGEGRWRCRQAALEQADVYGVQQQCTASESLSSLLIKLQGCLSSSAIQVHYGTTFRDRNPAALANSRGHRTQPRRPGAARLPATNAASPLPGAVSGAKGRFGVHSASGRLQRLGVAVRHRKPPGSPSDLDNFSRTFQVASEDTF